MNFHGQVKLQTLTDYDWPSGDGAKPFAVQKTTVALIAANPRSYVLNDMGTGKTKSSLWAWDFLHRAGKVRKLLVVAPLSTLNFVWAREIAYTMPWYKAVVLHGTREKRLELLVGDYDIYIINHEGLPTIVSELYARTDINCLILDELAVYRSHSSKRARQMWLFAQRFVWVWGLTGRPMPNAPTDVWSQCKILTPTAVPKFWRHAQTALMYQIDQFRWLPRADAVERAYSWMQPAVRFALSDVVELPEAIYRTIPIAMSEEQATTYTKLSNHFAVQIREKRVTAANAAVALGKLLQAGVGHIYTNNPEYVTIDSEPRRETLLQLIDEAPHKVIVFAPWKHLIHHLGELLTDRKIDHVVVHGETTKRDTIFNAFQTTEAYRVMLAHPSCIHHGVTLTAATTIIWYAPIPSLEVYEQANARIRRVGQKHKQLFLHMQSSPVERRVYSLLRNKQRLQDEFLELVRTAGGQDDDER